MAFTKTHYETSPNNSTKELCLVIIFIFFCCNYLYEEKKLSNISELTAIATIMIILLLIQLLL